MNRRDALKILVSAPAVALVPKILQAEEAKPVPIPSGPIAYYTGKSELSPLSTSRAQNLSMAELHQAFLHKWIPVGHQRRNYPHTGGVPK